MSEVMNTNKILRRISYPRVNSEPMNNDVQMSWPTKDAPPIDQNRVFKMSYNSRDFRNSDVSAGSINVMSSLKEKLAEKSASGSFSGCAKKTPSRVHAMLNDQLGTVDDEPEMRFHSEQTKTVPSKVFQALQHSYPGVDGTQRMPPRSELYEHYTPAAEVDYDYGHFQSNQTTAVPSKVFQALQHSYPGNEAQRISRQTGYHPMRPSEIEYDEGDIHERFVGNPTNKVPSKVFQALQHNYGTDAAPDISRYQNTDTRTFNERNTNQIPSKSFQMLHQQYSDEKDFKPSAAISGDLQDALDLLEQELDAMTTGKGQSSTNPLITVPLPKGVNRHERVSQDLAPSSSIENQKIQVPLYRGVPNTGYQAQNYQQMNQDDVTAPPVPVRVDSKKFQHPVRGQQPNEVVYEAPVARQLTSPRALSNRKNFNENEVMVAPIANVEKVVAYSAELETPWINPNKDDQRKGNRSLIIKPKSSSRSSGHYIKDGRTDSIDSTGSYSSIQERIPDFDPETYIVTTKPPSVSSRGLRSDSSDSGQSFSSYSSNLEPRHDEETYKGVSKTDGNKSNEPFQEVNKPRKMVINVNGKAKITKSENNEDDARQMIKYRDDGSMNTGEVRELGGHGSGGHRHDLKIEESERVPSPLANLQEMMDMIQNDDVFTDDMKMQNEEYERKEEESQNKRIKEIESRVQKTETSKLKDLKLEQLNSEEINEVFLQNDEQPMMFEKFSSPVQSRIQVKSGISDEEPTPCDPLQMDGDPRRTSAVHIQSRKQQQQHQLICTGPVARKSNQSEGDQQKSPPVNIQMSRNSHRRSIQLDQSMKFDEDHLTSRSSQSTNNKLCPNKSNSSITTSKKRTPVRDESFIVASEVRDSNEMSEERLREAFEVINATADRILDQIDKVGSFNGDDDGDYYPYEQYNDKRTSTNTTYYDGPQMDENSNEYGPTKYQRGTPSTYDKKNKEKLMTRTEAKPIRLTNNQPFIESPNRQISATSSGIRITLPAFSVKVSANNGSPDHAQPQR